MTLNKYPLQFELIERQNSLGIVVSVIENNEVIKLHYLEDILGSEYHDITHHCLITQDILDKLCFHEKTKEVLFKLSYSGDVSFGVLNGGHFIEL